MVRSRASWTCCNYKCLVSSSNKKSCPFRKVLVFRRTRPNELSPLCKGCIEKFSSKMFCPVCEEFYVWQERRKWVQCEACGRWAHRGCSADGASCPECNSSEGFWSDPLKDSAELADDDGDSPSPQKVHHSARQLARDLIDSGVQNLVTLRTSIRVLNPEFATALDNFESLAQSEPPVEEPPAEEPRDVGAEFRSEGKPQSKASKKKKKAELSHRLKFEKGGSQSPPLDRDLSNFDFMADESRRPKRKSSEVALDRVYALKVQEAEMSKGLRGGGGLIL
jgi:hypothetical protein